MAKNVYLCGPITGTDYDTSALGWRKDVFDALTPLGIEVRSPMRGKNSLVRAGEKIGGNAYNDNPLATTQAVLGRDKADTQNADLLFVNLLDAPMTSIGSMVELGWASGFHRPIPILLVMPKEGKHFHDHMFVKGLSTWWVDNMAEAIAIAKIFLVPGV